MRVPVQLHFNEGRCSIVVMNTPDIYSLTESLCTGHCLVSKYNMIRVTSLGN